MANVDMMIEKKKGGYDVRVTTRMEGELFEADHETFVLKNDEELIESVNRFARGDSPVFPSPMME